MRGLELLYFCNDRNSRNYRQKGAFMKPMLAQIDPATVTVWTYLLYLPISVAMTIWVARTLHKNGRIFLVDNFQGNEPLADSVDHLLVVGFYLVNVGFV